MTDFKPATSRELVQRVLKTAELAHHELKTAIDRGSPLEGYAISPIMRAQMKVVDDIRLLLNAMPLSSDAKP